MMMRGGGVEVATAAGVNYNNYNFFYNSCVCASGVDDVDDICMVDSSQ